MNSVRVIILVSLMAIVVIFYIKINFYDDGTKKMEKNNNSEKTSVNNLNIQIPFVLERDSYKFKNKVKNFYLNDVDKKLVYKKLEEAVFVHNEKNEIKIDLARYGQQYIAVIDEKTGEKSVWVNCFIFYNQDNSLKYAYWQNDIVGSLDGGNTIFTIIINLDTGKYYNFLNNNGQEL